MNLAKAQSAQRQLLVYVGAAFAANNVIAWRNRIRGQSRSNTNLQKS
jgi:hypothetical protein